MKFQAFSLKSYSFAYFSSKKSPTITAKGTERIIPQNPIIVAQNNADTMRRAEFTPSCFSIKSGVITLFCTHWIAKKTAPAIIIPQKP